MTRMLRAGSIRVLSRRQQLQTFSVLSMAEGQPQQPGSSGSSQNAAGQRPTPTVTAVQLDQRTLDAIIAGVTAQWQAMHGQPSTGSASGEDPPPGGKQQIPCQPPSTHMGVKIKRGQKKIHFAVSSSKGRPQTPRPHAKGIESPYIARCHKPSKAAKLQRLMPVNTAWDTDIGLSMGQTHRPCRKCRGHKQSTRAENAEPMQVEHQS